MTPLAVLNAGAVTAAGLNFRQSVAAFVAGLDGFEEIAAPDEFGETQVVAKVPANWRLKPDMASWLLNLAARAGAEAMAGVDTPLDRVLLVCVGPSGEREHECWKTTSADGFRDRLAMTLGGAFAEGSRVIDGGAAAALAILPEASLGLGQTYDAILLIGFDSAINAGDMGRLRAAERLHGQSAQGLVPGEGAGAVLLVAAGGDGPAIRSVGFAKEADNVLGEKQSQGRGMQEALEAACSSAGVPESGIEFVVGNMNGERYQALEALIYRPRFYRTRREFTATAFPAMSFGETGSASGVLSLAIAHDAITQGYGPGRVAMLEVSSDAGFRAAAYLS